MVSDYPLMILTSSFSKIYRFLYRPYVENGFNTACKIRIFPSITISDSRLIPDHPWLWNKYSYACYVRM